MTFIVNNLLKAKFRGCLLGCLLGDCCGEPFESLHRLPCDQITVQQFFDNLEENKFKGKIIPYTDDTVMTINIAETLIKTQPVDYKRMAILFTESYFAEPPVRNYGGGVRAVFKKLRNTNYEDIYKPAAEQFYGGGSFGNGGAMRVAPIALYFYDETEFMIDAVSNATKITHAHLLGVNGALLQCFAVQQALLMDPKGSLDICKFVEDLIKKIKCFEESYVAADTPSPYQTKLKSVLAFLTDKKHAPQNEILYDLGNDESALGTVPTAIFCFLRAQAEIPGVSCENKFRRTIQYAVTLGGATDTIAAMAGAIAGAYYGVSGINRTMLGQCENHKKIMQFADKLYAAHLKKNYGGTCCLSF